MSQLLITPRRRGAAPIQWAIANGETRTGVTTMQLDRGMDTGPILLQEECDIEAGDTTQTVEPRLAAMGAALLVTTLSDLAAGTLTPRKQDETRATKAPLIRKSDGAISFERPAAEIANRLRGFSPWPGLQFAHARKSVKILAAVALKEKGSAVPGVVLRVSRDGVDVACGAESTLRLLRVQPESRGPVSAFDFANGAKVTIGQVIGATAPSD